MSTEEWQRTGFWYSGSMVTQLGTCGQHLASSDHNGEVSVWNPSNGELVRTFTGHFGRVMAFAEVHGLLATCSYDKTVRLWKLSQNQQVDQIVFQSSLPTCMVAWDGKLVVGDSRTDIRIFDGEEDVWTCIWTFGVSGLLTSLAVSSRNELLFVVGGYVYAIPPNKSSLRVRIAHDRLDKCVCTVGDALVVGYSNKIVSYNVLFKEDAHARKLILTNLTDSVRGMVAVGGRLAVATSGGLVTFVD
jgi:WD40 repeat protein